MVFTLIILSVGIENAFILWCCCKAAGNADRMAMEVIRKDS